MTNKDPAFLFYSKDWLEGTAEYSPEEKGVYIDLLAHQHQKKSLPTEPERLARLTGLSVEKFTEIWKILSLKFKLSDGRLVNNRLEKEGQDRAIKSKRNKIIAFFSVLLRQSELDKKTYAAIRKIFKVSDFEHLDNERLSERISEWYQSSLKSIEDGNGNGNETIYDNIEKGGMGEKTKDYSPLPDDFIPVWDLWLKHKTKKFKDEDSEKIGRKKILELSFGNSNQALKIVEQSIANSYQGLFHLKNADHSTMPSKKDQIIKDRNNSGMADRSIERTKQEIEKLVQQQQA